MKLKPFSRDNAYFRSLRDTNMRIAHGDLDSNFNTIIDYLNEKILPVVKSLDGGKVVGIEGNENSFLRNIGDGTTKFDIIRSSDLTNYVITLNKFKKQIPLSVIASDASESLKAITDNEGNKVLISSNTLAPKWNKLKFSNFETNTIKSNKVAVGALSAKHLADGILNAILPDNIIETSYIKENTITSPKLAPNAFTSEKISATLMNTRVAGNNLHFQNKCFSARVIQDNSVDIYTSFLRQNTGGYRYPIVAGVLSHENFTDNSIDITCWDNRYFSVVNRLDYSIIPEKIQDGSFNIPEIVSTVDDSYNKKIKKNNLSPEIKAILVNRGGLTP